MSQLSVLLWKNYLIKKRNLSATFCELLLPIVLVCVLVWLRNFTSSEITRIPAKTAENATIDVGGYPLGMLMFSPDCEFHMPYKNAKFAVAPQKEGSEFVAFLQKVTGFSPERFISVYESNAALESYIASPSYPNHTQGGGGLVCGGLVFNSDIMSKNPSYTLRFNTTNHRNGFVNTRRQISIAKLEGLFGAQALQWYMRTGFLSTQLFVDQFITLKHMNASLQRVVREFNNKDRQPSPFDDIIQPLLKSTHTKVPLPPGIPLPNLPGLSGGGLPFPMSMPGGMPFSMPMAGHGGSFHFPGADLESRARGHSQFTDRVHHENKHRQHSSRRLADEPDTDAETADKSTQFARTLLLLLQKAYSTQPGDPSVVDLFVADLIGRMREAYGIAEHPSEDAAMAHARHVDRLERVQLQAKRLDAVFASESLEQKIEEETGIDVNPGGLSKYKSPVENVFRWMYHRAMGQDVDAETDVGDDTETDFEDGDDDLAFSDSSEETARRLKIVQGDRSHFKNFGATPQPIVPQPGGNPLDNWIKRAGGKAAKLFEAAPAQSVYFTPFPTASFISDPFMMVAGQFLSLILFICFSYSVSRLISGIVVEKENRIREGMRMMGLSEAAFYTSWFLTYFAIFLFLAVSLALLLFYGEVFAYSDPILTGSLFVLFGLATFSFGFLVSTLFSNAKQAATLGVMAFFVSQFCVQAISEDSSRNVRRAWSLLPTVAFLLTGNGLADLEKAQIGVTFYTATATFDDWSFADGLMMLGVDSLLYLLLGLYLDQVLPTEFGPRLHPLFFLKPVSSALGLHSAGRQRRASFDAGRLAGGARLVGGQQQGGQGFFSSCLRRCVGMRAREPMLLENSAEHQDARGGEDGPSPRLLERPHPNQRQMEAHRQCVQIDGLKKRFLQDGNVIRAVDGLTLNMYPGEIFALLGHNGAGKTTTISVLTGLLAPTEGSVKIFEHDIPADIHNLRRSLGVCPQHNVLWDDLTVYEHVRLFAAFRDMSGDVDQKVRELIEAVGLGEKMHVLSKALSGGMKRKLSVAIAFIGDPKLIVLDEPTSGMDPYSRRALWDLLKRLKENRIIILTTHYMEEADVLGDRIAIMAGGKLKCCGSSLFLKNLYGCGYNLTMNRVGQRVEEQHTEEGAAAAAGGVESTTASSHDMASNEEVLALIRTVVPEAEILSEVGAEFAVRLPFAASSRFQRLFDALDAHRSSLGIGSYGVSVTTLEEVFLKVASGEMAAVNQRHHALDVPSATHTNTTQSGETTPPSVAAAPLSPITTPQLPASSGSGSSPALMSDGSRFTSPHQKQDSTGGVGSVDRKKAVRKNKTHPADVEVKAPLLSQNPTVSTDGEISPTSDAAAEVSVPAGCDHTRDTRGSALVPGEPLPLMSGAGLYWKQLKALLAKRYWYAKRDLRAMFCQLVLPVMMLTFGFLVLQISLQRINQPQLVLDTSAYNTRVKGPSKVIPFGSDAVLKTDASNFMQAGIDVNLVDAAPWLPLDHRLPVDADARVNNTDDPDMPALGRSKFIKGFELPDPLHQRLFNFSVNLLASRRDMQASRFAAFAFIEDHNNPFRKTLTDMGVDVDEAMRLIEEARNHNESYVDPDLPPPDKHVGSIASIFSLLLGSGSVFVNTSALHSAGVYQNVRANMLLSAGGFEDTHITTINHPLPLSYWQKNLTESASGLVAALFVIISFSFIPAGIVAYIVRERQTAVKFQQFVSGVSYITYWLSNFLFDMSFYLLPLVCALGLFYFFKVDPLIKGDAVWATVALLSLYGPACCAQTYLMSFLFDSYTTAQNVTLATNVIVGTILSLVSWIMHLLGNVPRLAYIGEWDLILSKFYRLLPAFCLGHGILQIPACSALNTLNNKKVKGCSSFYELDVLGWDLIYLAAESTVYIVLVLVLDATSSLPAVRRLVSRLWPPPALPEGSLVHEDDDVRAEKQRVASIRPDPSRAEQQVIRVDNVRKVYRGPPAKHAVKGVSFAAGAGEVIGVLGVNGAGKTSTLKMLCGDAYPDAGSVHIAGRNISTELSACRRLIGYCPQFDAQLDLLTCKEHLTLFAHIKGIPDHLVSSVVSEKLEEMNLVKETHKRAGTLSGGNRRKLSVAVAMIGEPPIVFMDEPSCGMDPVNRRFMWTVIQGIAQRRKRSSILVTTHSMEEAEALATRLLIMVEGQAKCIGTTQHVKEVYGQGFELNLKTRHPEDPEVDALLASWHFHSEQHLSAAEISVLCGDNTARRQAALEATQSPVLAQIERTGHVVARVFAEWWLVEESGLKLQAVLARDFPGSRVLEHHGYMWRFNLPKQEHVSLGALFGLLESRREEACIAEYSLSQTTLEQIFNQFAALAENPHEE